MRGKKLPEFWIQRDTREHDTRGWFWKEEVKKPGLCRVLGTIEECISAGDYTIKGLEDKVVIERKTGFSELFGNMSPKENKIRFEKEMIKLESVQHKYILIESSLSNDILSLGIPQHYKGPPASRVLDWIISLGIDYNVNILFVGNTGKRVARTIFDNIVRKYQI